ncbi:cytochrome-c peroxidase [Nitrincola iocasae]|uniref:Cytochrome-c peroxidase n=1 Tax=Nitrincola iocasae TaxID=2614693 RepID=A0A5J6LDD1_9GAMM|nr:cytochrome c peroxidase [Nitrincola iocasae]QEW06537.1 cytochrome-c peroxidase [Nitrincola iocasae]
MIKPLNWKTPLLIAVVFLIMLIKSRYQTSSQDAELSLRQAYSGAVDSWPAPWVDAGIEWQALAEIPALAPGDEHLIALGEQLFFDPLLSESGQIACASCHEPELAFADARKVSFGHERQAGRRNAPSILLSGHFQAQFWDGRAASLEAQVLMPVQDPVEMAFTLPALQQRLQTHATYPAVFAQVSGETTISLEVVSQALSAYIRSLRWRSTAFDRFMQGDSQALDDVALQGLHLFRTKARCMNCHYGALMSDQQYHNLGLTYYGRLYEDLGRYAVTGQVKDVGAFRTPSLRGVSQTGPWMHNGLFSSLEGILRMYNAGMPRSQPSETQQQDPLFPETSHLLQPLGLSDTEIQALKHFLDQL